MQIILQRPRIKPRYSWVFQTTSRHHNVYSTRFPQRRSIWYKLHRYVYNIM